MHKDDHDDGLRDKLAAWDPAKCFGESPADLLARVRESLRGEPTPLLPAFLSPARLGWAMAVLIFLLGVLTWQQMPVGLSTREPTLAAKSNVRVQLRSSNGTRIFWTIQPASMVDADERRDP